MSSDTLKAPFPYFGGKRAVASLIWKHFGEDVTNYCEPFAGSCATLLARPRPFDGVETVNDVNAYVTNFWRAVGRDPDAVVEHCDYPVSELDLHARHRWLVLSPEAIAFRERMRTDPDHFDAKIAGWWVWGACCWIGGEWCRYTDGPGGRPALSCEGEGVAATGQQRRPFIAAPGSDSGPGVHGAASQQVPRLGARFGQPDMPGVLNPAGGRPQITDAFDVGRGVNSNGDLGTCAARREWLLDWFRRLQDRLRLTRVCCGHWLRVCDSESVTTRLGTTAVFLDPPYPIRRAKGGKKSRAGGLYQGDDVNSLDTLRDEILTWCVERGALRSMRICVACYEGDGYEPLEALGWRVESWEAQGGYGNRGKGGKEQRKRERLYFSPHCVFEAHLFDHLDVGEATA